MATYSGIKKIKIGDNVFELAVDWSAVTSKPTIPSAYSLPLAASGTRGGIQIGYSSSGQNYAVKLSSEKAYVTVPWTDVNVTSTTVTDSTTMYLTGSTSGTTNTGTLSKHASASLYFTKDTNTSGGTTLTLGNNIASGTAGAKYGSISLYGSTAYYITMKTEDGLPTANRTIYFPSYAGTMYLTCTSTTDAVGGATTAPVYVDNTGRIQAVTSIPYSLLTGTPTIPTDTNTWRKVQLNGTDKLGTATSTNPLNLKAGTNMSITESSGTFTFTATDTDTKVTSSANHYTPSTASGNDKTASASGATAAWSIDVVKGITINTDGKGHITGLSVTSGKIPANPNSDEKVKTIALTSGTTYYPILATGANAAANRQVDSILGSFKYTVTAGTTSAIGKAFLEIGNNIASGTANNVKGILKIYGSNSTAYLIDAQSETTASEVSLILPDAGGTLLSSGCLNYTTSGNNRAVQRDSNGNLYVTQKDDNTTYSAGTGLSLSSTTFSVKTGYTTSGNNRKVQADSSGNLYVVQKDTNTYVTQTADTTAAWRKVLGTYNSGSAATTTITSGSSNVAYYDADGPAFNTSTGELYTKGYLMYLATTDALYTAIDGLGWTSDVIS